MNRCKIILKLRIFNSAVSLRVKAGDVLYFINKVCIVLSCHCLNSMGMKNDSNYNITVKYY